MVPHRQKRKGKHRSEPAGDLGGSGNHGHPLLSGDSSVHTDAGQPRKGSGVLVSWLVLLCLFVSPSDQNESCCPEGLPQFQRRTGSRKI